MDNHFVRPENVFERRGVKNFEWFDLSGGVSIQIPGGESAKQLDLLATPKLPKTYDTNNGVVVFVDEEQKIYVGPQTEERMRALQEEGYRKESIGVPFSNGEVPSHVDVAERWRKLMAEGS
jgi:hypothetical protein